MCHGQRDYHENGGNVMAKKLDAEQIERARHKSEKSSRREEEKRHIQETIAKNRSGERKGRVIMPPRCVLPHTSVSAQLKKHRSAVLRCRSSTSHPL